MRAADHPQVQALRDLYRPPNTAERLATIHDGLCASADALAALRQNRSRRNAENLAGLLSGLHREGVRLAAEIES